MLPVRALEGITAVQAQKKYNPSASPLLIFLLHAPLLPVTAHTSSTGQTVLYSPHLCYHAAHIDSSPDHASALQ
jgi:hypothetical protein